MTSMDITMKQHELFIVYYDASEKRLALVNWWKKLIVDNFSSYEKLKWQAKEQNEPLKAISSTSL